LRGVNRVAQHPVRAFLAALAAVAVLSVMDAVMKHLVLALGLFTVSVWRSASNLLFGSALYLPRRREWPSRKTLWIHLIRGVDVTVMAALFFWGIARVPLAQALALTFIAPLIAMLLAPLFLKERLNARLIGGAIAAFAGVLVIVVGQAQGEVRPDVLLGIAAIIGSAICYSGNILMMRWQALVAGPLEINFFQAIVVFGMWLAVVPLIGLPTWPASELGWIILASILSTTGGMLFAWAYARGEASYLAVTEYSGFIWASICGWVAFHERVSLYTLAGAVLIVGGCLIGARGKVTEPPEMDYT
jgi:S-adenosylmethionine uptake transporter